MARDLHTAAGLRQQTGRLMWEAVSVDFYNGFELASRSYGDLDRCNHAFMTRGFVKTPIMSTFLEWQHRLAYMQRDVGPLLPADDL